jgi:hypothetical protein
MSPVGRVCRASLSQTSPTTWSGLDAVEGMVRLGPPCPRVTYAVSAAERLLFPADSFDALIGGMAAARRKRSS